MNGTFGLRVCVSVFSFREAIIAIGKLPMHRGKNPNACRIHVDWGVGRMISYDRNAVDRFQ